MEQLVKLLWLNAENCFIFCDELFCNHIYSHFDSCGAGAFTVAALEHVESSFLNGELHILHVAIVFFKFSADIAELFVNLCVCLLKLSKFLRGTNTCNNILTLCVHKVFAHELVLSVSWITAKANACS